MEADQKLTVEEMKIKIAEYKVNLAQIESIIDSEKSNVDKLELVDQLKKMKDNIKQALKYYHDIIAYETDLLTPNEHPITLNDIGKVCCCFYNNGWTTGKIVNLQHESNETQETIQLRLFGFIDSTTGLKAETSLPFKHVKINKEYSWKDLVKGYFVEAIYYEDGNWYEAVICETYYDEQLIEVEFLEYKNKEKVSLDSIRISPIHKVKNEGIKAKNEEKLSKLDNKLEFEFTLPENLRLNPSDNDQQRIAKRKKVKALKQSHKHKILEELNKQKQDVWKDFVSANQNKKGFSKPIGFGSKFGK